MRRRERNSTPKREDVNEEWKSRKKDGERKIDDGELTAERLDELRIRVRARKIKKNVDTIMNVYYLVLMGIVVSFYHNVKYHGIDHSIEWYFKGGVALLVFAAILNYISGKLDSGELQACSGMVAITGIPIVAITFFVFMWINIFFNESWNDAWRALVET
mmetsp:Transcript_1360/g.2882  ORF Transcript_1360/g.2882 Transcript_1360/m.2882 type:complete len:160 (-) Transcript_1360:342-821(-)|eukprot:CAMPEP_0172609786 /NCGR_PEP_ID=MMETSP1068-20121228/29700_1 /TAXON_ID=35684 /ORGANISM="Pseudopedinella elastica, Strain CCMP716" /LENGTH=159 /DNA_ID=CAMNT_0013413373 /DNA_START=64 /DNA_END=543 /DNA_ORIENTATION=-